MNKLILLLGLWLICSCDGLTRDDLYEYSNEPSEVLPRGDEQFEFVKLNTPVHFYSEIYDHIYINTNGILTFRSEFQNFLNLPFPLEYPSIAPFYSNIDTTLDNDTATIVYFESYDAEYTSRAEELVRTSFSDTEDFEVISIFVVTWEDVGHYDRKNNLQNNFQAIIICGINSTYVQFMYPEDGINWLQADTGASGLPDVRAQSGFIAEDGRFFILKGSGTDNVRFLASSSNIGMPGNWIFKVGQLSYEENVKEPDGAIAEENSIEPKTCANGGNFKCHSAAICSDTTSGFQCACRNNYYGNGYNCIKNDVPLRVSGTVSGSIESSQINAQLQSYIVMMDGRSYTAISTLDAYHGTQFQLLQSLGGTIGWLFAKPIGNILNGYQITGGKFNNSVTLRFDTGEAFYINQIYLGLNVWDQLSAEIEISGSLPMIPPNDKLQMPDFTAKFKKVKDGVLQLNYEHTVYIPSEERDMNVNVYQQITYESNNYLNRLQAERFEGTLKTSKINLGFETRENASRMGMLNKIGVEDTLNPCSDESSNCGENTVCIATGPDAYECTCKNGYTYDTYSNADRINCVDIDECSGQNICDENADCYNEPGGYKCLCNDGFYGNGYKCTSIQPEEEALQSHIDLEREPEPEPEQAHEYRPTYPPSSYEQTPKQEEDNNDNEYDDEDENAPECVDCSRNAECIDSICTCKSGFSGDGYDCQSICPDEYYWNGEVCVKTTPVYNEIQPLCTALECTCPSGYELIEYAIASVCRLMEPEEEVDVSCDAVNNCHEHANCEWNPDTIKYQCVCAPGFDGNGFECTEKEVSCLDEEDICDQHAICQYNLALKKSVCVCEKGYEGDGRTCHEAPECYSSEDCGAHSVCIDGLCACRDGYERDAYDYCVLAGSCGGAYCAENAVCKYEAKAKVFYCLCPPEFIGNGVTECKSIPPSCNVRNICGLYASCLPNYRDSSKFECVCDPGYFGDGFLCTPERNCKNIPDLCDPNANCLSTTSGYQCICNDGFIGNGSMCNTAPRLDSGFLLISQGVANVRVPFDGKRGYPVAMAHMAIGLDKDCATGRVYWSDISAKQIVSCKYDGTDRKPFITKDILSPEGVAVDWISRRIYWTDSSKDTIEVASLDDPELRAVLINKHLVNPRGIAVDPHQNKLYWSDWNRESPKIEWSNLDGTERSILLSSPDVQLPNSLAIASHTGELCFADAGTFKIECIDTYTKSVRTVAANVSYPFGLAITDDLFYWTDWTTKKIESVDAYGKRKPGIPTPLFGSHKMYGMAAITEKCPLFYSPCVISNGSCPSNRICLTNPRAPSGKSCKCARDDGCNEASHLDD